jgi:Ni,Fe-hydrogenase III large subunit/Ni,Fe-hydrogenase III component G
VPFRTWNSRATHQPGAGGLRALRVEREEWRQLAESVAGAGGWLAALWADGSAEGRSRVHAAYHAADGGLIATLEVEAGQSCPGIQDLFPAAARMQRAMADLCGITTNASDARPWLRHSAWPESHHPLADSPLQVPGGPVVDGYDFVRVEGDGVHEIAVGPVHAGIIEPGHFRFSVVGEKVLRLEERLGYVHKGTELRFTGLQAVQGHRLAARVSGDSAVAFSWAYCQALESLADCTIPARAAYLRALYLEIERIQNHLGDLGALGNDAGFAFGLTHFSRLKERWLRATEAACGQRYLMDAIVPGGARADIAADAARALAGHASRLAADARALREIYDEHPGVRDRFLGAGEIKPQLARQLGLTGLAARASGQEFDSRIDLPTPPYDTLHPRRAVHAGGDVAARVAVRFEELQESCRLVAEIAETIPAGPYCAGPETIKPDTLAVGWIEGWRGPTIVALEVAPDGLVRRCHPHDPSWQNWPALEHAVIGNIVPDFPLINKSFNLSYSGHDL